MPHTVRLERTGPGGVVARVTLSRPDVHNAFDATLIAELRTAFADPRPRGSGHDCGPSC